MQAITTKYHGPTNTKGSRMTARALAGSVTMGYDHSIGIQENHELVARKLADKFGWLNGPRGTLVSGQTHSGDYVHVFTGSK